MANWVPFALFVSFFLTALFGALAFFVSSWFAIIAIPAALSFAFLIRCLIGD